MNNLLAQVQSTLGYSVSTIPSISLNWLAQLIKILIGSIGILGVGIIVFTLILKCITLPLDILSRVSSKKQSLIMERMRPQMEKLQKQYANDKTMYSQKVRELQAKSGFSMLSSCLPAIISIVVFLFVLSAFTSYSQYAHLESYNDLVNAYNGVVETYVIKEDGSGFLIPIDNNYVLVTDGSEPADYEVDFNKFAAHYNGASSATKEQEEEVFLKLANEYKGVHTGYDGAFSANIVNQYGADGELSETASAVRVTLVNYYLEKPAAQAAADYYKEHNNGFLWVKNLWFPDSALYKEMPNFADFKKAVSKANINDGYAESYDRVTAGLESNKSAPNGYFVLIILSIGLMLLQQFISMRANKAVNDLSTVDGSGARTNKWMMIMMPLIFGILAFVYSAAFALYMITNTIFSILTTLLINKLVDVWFKKKEEQGKLDEILNRASVKRAKRAQKRAAAYGARTNKRK